MRSEGLPYDIIKEELQRWYNKDKTVTIQRELANAGDGNQGAPGIGPDRPSGQTLPEHIGKPFTGVLESMDGLEAGLARHLRRFAARVYFWEISICSG